VTRANISAEVPGDPSIGLYKSSHWIVSKITLFVLPLTHLEKGENISVAQAVIEPLQTPGSRLPHDELVLVTQISHKVQGPIIPMAAI